MGFKDMCGHPSVLGTIDGSQLAISKLHVGLEDYYHFKSGGYTLQCQVVVDENKKFMDLFVDMFGSIHDVKVLRKSLLYVRASDATLFDLRLSDHGFTTYLFENEWLPPPSIIDGASQSHPEGLQL